MARKVELHIPKLTDCRVHFDDEKEKRREESSIFLTEGDSAGGPMIQARDVHTQAIFSLKGKPLNVFGLKRDTVYKNEELYNIMRALGIEDGLDGLRYNKGHRRNGCGRGRHAHPEPAPHVLPPLLRAVRPPGPPPYPGDAALPRAHQG